MIKPVASALQRIYRYDQAAFEHLTDVPTYVDIDDFELLGLGQVGSVRSPDEDAEPEDFSIPVRSADIDDPPQGARTPNLK